MLSTLHAHHIPRIVSRRASSCPYIHAVRGTRADLLTAVLLPQVALFFLWCEFLQPSSLRQNSGPGSKGTPRPRLYMLSWILCGVCVGLAWWPIAVLDANVLWHAGLDPHSIATLYARVYAYGPAAGPSAVAALALLMVCLYRSWCFRSIPDTFAALCATVLVGACIWELKVPGASLSTFAAVSAPAPAPEPSRAPFLGRLGWRVNRSLPQSNPIELNDGRENLPIIAQVHVLQFVVCVVVCACTTMSQRRATSKA
jgi:hypothetical protein